MIDLNIIPRPQKIEIRNLNYAISQNCVILLTQEDKEEIWHSAEKAKVAIREYAGIQAKIWIQTCGDLQPDIEFKRDSCLHAERYRICVGEKGILIVYGTATGAYRAVTTLRQIIRQVGRNVPHMEIDDYPDYRARGLMMDISRGKIPKLETLMHFVDILSDLKYNQLQLYVENFCFAYPDFPQYWADKEPFSAEDIVRLDTYCKLHHMELVCNQNSFGHLLSWLTQPQWSHLRNYDGTIKVNIFNVCSAELNPLDPESLSFLDQVYSNILPSFTSDKLNVGCDETFSIGYGKTEEICKTESREEVYFGFLLKIHQLAASYGKKIQFWHDMLRGHPEILRRLPKDATALAYYYETGHIDDCLKELSDCNVRFYVSPGTSTWGSFAGKDLHMRTNLVNTAKAGVRFGAEGFLLTEWGDGGHPQFPGVAYPSYVYGADLAWNTNGADYTNTKTYLNEVLFADKTHTIADILADVAGYYEMEHTGVPNGTVADLSIRRPLEDTSFLEGAKPEQYLHIIRMLEDCKKRLDETALGCADASLMLEEIHCNIEMLIIAAAISCWKLENFTDSSIRKDQLLISMKKLKKDFIRLWYERNRISGRELFVGVIQNKITQLSKYI
jgi:hexosaminidase